MGSGASNATLGVQTQGAILQENEQINLTRICVPQIKGNPSGKHLYEIGYKIGEGSFACVRLATSFKTKEKVAVKEIYTGDLLPEQLADLEQEISALSQFRHNNIVQLHEVYRESKSIYMICEYLSGGELFDAICEQEFYKENDARRVMRSITYALIYMHSHGVMHRDLKPENLILVSNHADTDLKLIDFGFACRFGPSIPRETRLCGTPGYVAPEMIRGAPYGAEVDMWSVGVIMYVLLAGMPPFASDDAQELFEIIQSGRYTYPQEYWGEVSISAKNLIDQLLVVDGSKRLTAAQMLDHPWMKDDGSCDGNLSHNLQQMRTWNSGRKLQISSLAVKSCVKFRLAGKRYKENLIHAAKRARELEDKGISWTLDRDEIRRRETAFLKKA